MLENTSTSPLIKVCNMARKDSCLILEEIEDDVVERASVAMQVESMPCVRLYIGREVGRSRESHLRGLQDPFTISAAEC